MRVAVEERASFSPDALVGMEASLRFPGPETMESKIFGRLSAWQNWIFQRPNAVGEQGALPAVRYGPRGRLRSAEGMNMAGVDLNQRIPNNVGLGDDRRLRRALEAWQPAYVDWWKGGGAGRAPDERRVPAHRRGRGYERLGALRLREDAGLPVGHLPRPARPGPGDRLRRPQGGAGLAGGSRRAPRGAPAHHHRAGGHRARLRRAAAVPRRDLPLALRLARAPPGQRGGRPALVGDGLPSARLFRARRARRGRRPPRTALGGRGPAPHPRRLQRDNPRLARLLHVHLLHRPRREVPARRPSGIGVRPSRPHLPVHAEGGVLPHVRRGVGPHPGGAADRGGAARVTGRGSAARSGSSIPRRSRSISTSTTR